MCARLHRRVLPGAGGSGTVTPIPRADSAEGGAAPSGSGTPRNGQRRSLEEELAHVPHRTEMVSQQQALHLSVLLT